MAKKKQTSKAKLLAMKQEITAQFVFDVYVKFMKDRKRVPTEAELQKLGVSRNAVRWHFDSPKDLKVKVREKHPDLFKHIIDESVFTKANFKKLEEAVGKYERFVLTTAVAGGKVHKKGYEALKAYCKKNKALLLVLPVKDPASNFSSGNSSISSWELDPIFANNGDTVVFSDLALNDNLYVSGIKIGAKQVDPVTGLRRLAHDRSFIFASPKMRLEVVPNSNHKLPHVLMSTGAITVPDYETEKFLSMRTAYLAEFDHKLGAIVVEIDEKNSNRYFFRQLQIEPRTGRFVDLADYYHPDGTVTKLNAEAFSLGDIHVGEEDEKAMKVWKEVVAVTQPDMLILHDLFSGRSISHWMMNKAVSKALHALKGYTNLEAELKLAAKRTAELATWTKRGNVIVKANHDDFLPRYLEDGRWIKDHENFFMSNRLIAEMHKGKDCVKAGIEMFMEPEDRAKNLWLQRDEDFKIAGIECGVHGDKGPNGSRGSLRSIEQAHGACVIGHSHTPGILRDAWQNGTSTLLQLEYNSGASSWMHSSTLIYPNGARQMIHSIYGEWRRSKK